MSTTESRACAATGLARKITTAFYEKELELSGRLGDHQQGWEGMPEVAQAKRLGAAGVEGAKLRLFVTFTAALDRARDAEILWGRSADLYLGGDAWVFEPDAVVTRDPGSLGDVLHESRVSQRHMVDTDAWLRIADSIARGVSSSVNRAIFEGKGDAIDLTKAVRLKAPNGQSAFPMLAGPKVGPMWIRMLAAPGAAVITSLDALGVAVDVHVRRCTEYLGVTPTAGKPLRTVRRRIQEAWASDVREHGAPGPAPLTGTCAALDPALWFFGKWGCGHCEQRRAPIPISGICVQCQFEQVFPLREAAPAADEC